MRHGHGSSVSGRRRGEWFFVIEAGGNFETLATSETYQSRAACEHAIELIKQQAASATVHDQTPSATR
jgi:uncharacterized protein YegP (UPF0339 family)